MNNDDSDYECDGIQYHRNNKNELKLWLQLRMLEDNCNNCCTNIKKIFSIEPKSPPRFLYIHSRANLYPPSKSLTLQ